MGAGFMWWSSAASAQLLGQNLKQQRLRCIHEEVVTGKHPQREADARLVAPDFEVAPTNPVILQATKAGDEAVERRFGRVHVSFTNGKVCPQDWNHDLHEFGIFQQFSGSAIQATQFVQESPLGQGMDRPVSKSDLRRASRRDKQTNRLNARLSSELTSEFKGDQRSHTVPKEGKRLVQEGNQSFSEGLDKRREPIKRRLHQPSSRTGKLNRADLHIRWQITRPGAKNRRTGSCVREAEQTEVSLWVRLAAGNPGI